MPRTGRSALVMAALAAALAGGARADDAAPSWEAQNRQRARAGLLPRKPPRKPARAGTVAAAPPTAVPPAAASASAATRTRTATSTPTAAATPAPSQLRGTISEPRVESRVVTRAPGGSPSVVTRSFAPAGPEGRAPHAPGLLSRRWLASGEQVHRVVDDRGRISERRLDARGVVVEARVVGDAASLPVVAQRREPDGDVVQIGRDDSGALVALTRDGGGHLLGARVVPAAELGAL